MVNEFVQAFMENKDQIRHAFSMSFPTRYEQIVKEVVKAISDHKSDYPWKPDYEKIHVIDDGSYQGRLLFIIPERRYQPYQYWYAMINYGSCSCCDTLMGIGYRSSYDTPPTERQLDDVMTLALHVVQRMHEMVVEP